jgi:hypothetical protein
MGNAKDAEEEGKIYACRALLQSWKLLYSFGAKTELEELIWNYFKDGMPETCKIYEDCDSKLIGVKSIIADYKNKSGKVHKAHYKYRAIKKCYLGPVSKLGNEPIYFKTYTAINKKYFTLHINRLPNVKYISELFELNTLMEEEEEEEFELDFGEDLEMEEEEEELEINDVEIVYDDVEVVFE